MSERLIGWWQHEATGRLEYTYVGSKAELADLRQTRDDAGGWRWRGWTPDSDGEVVP